MKKIQLFMILAFVAFAMETVAQRNVSALLPMPNSIEQIESKKMFSLEKAVLVASNVPDDSFCRKELISVLKNRTGIDLQQAVKGSAKVEMLIDPAVEGKERYVLEITPKKMSLRASTETGLLYAVMTLDQLLMGDVVNTASRCVAPIRIDDAPRYAYRGIMLDPARHFLPVKDVKFFIDQMVKFKYNVLQLHLTDDQGWRIEIKSHPRLTEAGAFRNPNGGDQGPDNGFYTQEQLRDIVDYAAQRGIEVIPELDIPGHSVAVLAAYPELGCAFRQKEKKDLGSTTNMMLCATCERAYEVYDDIFREVAQVFPSARIHLGGDEAAVKTNWAKCDDCKALMKKEGYENPSQLMNIFFGRMLASVRKYGKQPVLWCELDNIWPPAHDYLFPYPQDVTLVTWRNALTPKCIELTREHGHKLIMAPGEHAYLDYPQFAGDLPEFNNWGMPITTLEQTYRLDPSYGLPHNEQTHILGVMATLWSEAIRDINRVCYMTFPRGLAIAESGWTKMEHRSWDSFKLRMSPNIHDLMHSGVSVRMPFEVYRK